MVKLIIGIVVGVGFYATCKFLHLGPYMVDARLIGAVALGLVTMAKVR